MIPHVKKTVRQKETSIFEHKRKHEKNSFSHGSSQQSSYAISQTSKPSIYRHMEEEPDMKSRDYDPRADVHEGYDPERPQLFLSENPQKKSKKRDLVEARPPQKHRIETEEQTEFSKESKKIKYEKNHLSSKHYSDVLKESREKKKKQKHGSSKREDVDSELCSSDVQRESRNKTESHHKTESHNKTEPHNKTKSAADKCDKEMLRTDMLHTKKSKSKDSSVNSVTKHKKPKLKLNCSEEFTSSEVSFEDCLGFNDIVAVKKKKKKSSKTQLANEKNSSMKDSMKKKPNNTKGEVPTRKHTLYSEQHTDVPKPSVKLDTLNIFPNLPKLQPDYCILTQRNLDFLSSRKKEELANEDVIRFTSSRSEKTAVYSGRKNFHYFTEVPSLYDCAIRVLIENIDAIECMGGVSFHMVKPLLEKCNPSQLLKIEDYNPHLIDSTNELWEQHCRRDYRSLSLDETETWRELYWRAHDERERKFKNVTASISASMSKYRPVRQVKLAFVDSIAKPPRDVARRQAKNSTAKNPSKHTTSEADASCSKVAPKSAEPVANNSVPGTSGSVAAVARKSASPIPPSSSRSVPKKPKVAPLMAKTLKSMKQCFRR